MLLFLFILVLHGYLVKQWRFQPGPFDIEATRFGTSAPHSYCWLFRTSEFYSLRSQFKHLSEAVCPNRGDHGAKKANFWNITPCGIEYIKFWEEDAAFIFKDLLRRAWRQQCSPQYYYQATEIRRTTYMNKSHHTHSRKTINPHGFHSVNFLPYR
jgi:hypothetical protein